MGQAKQRKTKGLGPKVAKVAKETSAPLPYNWYAETVARELAKHREECKDPACTHAFAVHRHEAPNTVAMVKSGEPKKIFLAFTGEGATHPYAPYIVLNLATGEEIASCFDEQGRVSCQVTGPTDSICATLLCHRQGVDVSFDERYPDSVEIVCAEKSCRKRVCFHGPNGVIYVFKLAPRPRADYPNIFCSVHGIRPSYVICKHILDEGAKPARLLPPTADDCGEAFCDPCEVHYPKNLEATGCKSVCAIDTDRILGGKLEELLAKR